MSMTSFPYVIIIGMVLSFDAVALKSLRNHFSLFWSVRRKHKAKYELLIPPVGCESFCLIMRSERE